MKVTRITGEVCTVIRDWPTFVRLKIRPDSEVSHLEA